MDLFNYQKNIKLRRWRIQMGCGIIDIYSNETCLSGRAAPSNDNEISQ